MSKLTFFSLIHFLTSPFIFAQLYNLTSEEFDYVLTGSPRGTPGAVTNSLWFIILHVDWCQHCKFTVPQVKMAADRMLEDPEFKKLNLIGSSTPSEDAEDLDDDLDSKSAKSGVKYQHVQFASIDCTDDKMLTTRFNVDGYPSIMFWDKGSPIDGGQKDFRGSRHNEGILRYLERMAQTEQIKKAFNWYDIVGGISNENLVTFLHVADKETPKYYSEYATANRDRHLFYSAKPGQVNAINNTRAGISTREPGTYIIASPAMAGKVEIRKFPPISDDDQALSKFTDWTTANRFPGVWNGGYHNFYDVTHANVPTIAITYNSNDTTEEGLSDLRKQIWTTFSSGDQNKNPQQGGNFILIDYVVWKDTLSRFDIHKEEGHRTWVITDNFETWREDVDLLSFEKTLDIAMKAKLAEGATVKGSNSNKFVNTTQAVLNYCNKDWLIFVQGRSWMQRRFLEIRMIHRWVNKLYAYAENGPTEMLVAFAVIFVAVGVITFVLFLIWQVLIALWQAFSVPELTPEELEEFKKLQSMREDDTKIEDKKEK